jgi:hypothetical protein
MLRRTNPIVVLLGCRVSHGSRKEWRMLNGVFEALGFGGLLLEIPLLEGDMAGCMSQST